MSTLLAFDPLLSSLESTKKHLSTAAWVALVVISIAGVAVAQSQQLKTVPSIVVSAAEEQNRTDICAAISKRIKFAATP